MIRLPVYMESDLEWGLQIEQAADFQDSFLWVFDFGKGFPLHDSAFFASSALAMEEFTKTIWPRFQKQTSGIVLYEGTASFAEALFLSENTEQLFEEYIQEFPSCFNKQALYQLFAANSLSEFLHRMLAFLPEESRGICRIQNSFTDRALLAQLLCKRRFEYLYIDAPEAPWILSTSNVAISLPLDQKLDESAKEQMNTLFSTVSDFRLIPEESLNDYWDGVDKIIALPAHTSDRGMRLLEGFLATGGEVLFSE